MDWRLDLHRRDTILVWGSRWAVLCSTTPALYLLKSRPAPASCGGGRWHVAVAIDRRYPRTGTAPRRDDHESIRRPTAPSPRRHCARRRRRRRFESAARSGCVPGGVSVHPKTVRRLLTALRCPSARNRAPSSLSEPIPGRRPRIRAVVCRDAWPRWCVSF